MEKISKEKNQKLRDLLLLVGLSSVCFGMQILSAFLLYDLPDFVWIGTITVFGALNIGIVIIDRQKYLGVFRLLLCLILFLAAVEVAYLLITYTGLLKYFENFDYIKAWIVETGGWLGMLIYVGLTLMQVICLPLPSTVIILIATSIYGPLTTFILTTIGTIVGSVISFWLGKTFGLKLVGWIVGKEKTEKYSKFLNDKGKFLFIVMLLLPGFPDDILCMAAGLTAMTYPYFIVLISLTRPVMIAFTAFFGSGQIIPFSGWGIPVWILIILGMAALLIFAKKCQDKMSLNKDAKKIKSEQK